MSFLVSGYEFYKISDWNFCNRYPFHFDYSQIKENDKVFLNLDFFHQFKKELLKFEPKNKFILITHNSDLTFTQNHLDEIKNYVSHVYPINCNFSHEIVTKIPIGFVDDKYKPHNCLKKISEIDIDKNILLYLNFNISTNVKERQECYNYFKNFDFVTTEFGRPYEDFYIQIKRSKYVLSPDGTGYDCHRIYESILMDTIPIIKKNPLNDLYSNLPVIIVGSWEEVNKNFLDDNYEKFYNILVNYKKENPNWYQAKYWIK